MGTGLRHALRLAWGVSPRVSLHRDGHSQSRTFKGSGWPDRTSEPARPARSDQRATFDNSAYSPAVVLGCQVSNLEAGFVTLFEGQVGEQGTMFLLDPSGNALEFKGFADEGEIFRSE